MKTYLQIILECFSNMDIEGLRTYLKKDYSYQDASQATFLDKIESIFFEMKAKSDSYLEVIDGACCELSCEPHLIRTAYRFVGNESKDYLDLRFIEEKGSIQVNESDILDIFSCYHFCPKRNGNQLGDKIFIEIFLDEKSDFKPSTDFVTYSSLAKSAIRESKNIQGQEVEFAGLENWLANYQSTFLYFDEVLRDFSQWSFGEFMQFYYDLNSIIKVINQLKMFELPKSRNLDSEQNENELVEWVVKVEEFLGQNGSNFHEKFQLAAENSCLDYWGEFKIVGDPIEKVGELLINCFLPFKAVLLEKYFALTESELDRISEENSFMEDPQSLYKDLYQHLEIRERALKNGEFIPFYLNSFNGHNSN